MIINFYFIEKKYPHLIIKESVAVNNDILVILSDNLDTVSDHNARLRCI